MEQLSGWIWPDEVALSCQIFVARKVIADTKPRIKDTEMSEKHWHLIAYDVREPKRLRRVARILEGYGTRIQYSIFRCRLDREALEKLHWELSKEMDVTDDLLVMPMCACCAAKVPRHSTGDQSDWADPVATFRIA